MKIIKVSIVVAVFNEKFYIERCVKAILGQCHTSFELIIVDDGSTDGTAKIINEIKDQRIVYLRNDKRRGIAYSRNVGIHKAVTEYIFFTDADCMPTKYWLQEAIKVFEQKDCLGIEGKTCYETSRTSITDRIIENLRGGVYTTCNIAYRRKILEEVGYFNKRYELVSEDTDLARKVLSKGYIEFLPSMLVFHQQRKQTVKNYFQIAFRVFSKVKYINDTKDYSACFWKIMYPKHLIYILCPPLLFLGYRLTNLKELFLVPLIYLSYVFERVLIWIAAVKEGIFLL